jgi:hypothetical protein
MSLPGSGNPAGYPTGNPVGTPVGKKPVVAIVLGVVAAVVLVCVLGAVAVGVVLWRNGATAVQDAGPTSGGRTWQEELTAIDAVVDYRSSGQLVADHATGTIDYPQHPPVGGRHNPVWQTCTGIAYGAPIANEHAVHSLEHGAVWITYRSGLDSASVSTLTRKVTGNDYLMLSPVDGQDATVSVQAWGYQLKVDSAADKRIDAFIRAARVNASLEPGAPCSGGNSTTGTTPVGQ